MKIQPVEEPEAKPVFEEKQEADVRRDQYLELRQWLRDVAEGRRAYFKVTAESPEEAKRIQAVLILWRSRDKIPTLRITRRGLDIYVGDTRWFPWRRNVQEKPGG